MQLPKSDETIYLMESKDGMMVRVPASKLAEWEKSQNSEQPDKLTPEQELLKQEVLRKLFG